MKGWELEKSKKYAGSLELGNDWRDVWDGSRDGLDLSQICLDWNALMPKTL